MRERRATVVAEYIQLGIGPRLIASRAERVIEYPAVLPPTVTRSSVRADVPMPEIPPPENAVFHANVVSVARNTP